MSSSLEVKNPTLMTPTSSKTNLGDSDDQAMKARKSSPLSSPNTSSPSPPHPRISYEGTMVSMLTHPSALGHGIKNVIHLENVLKSGTFQQDSDYDSERNRRSSFSETERSPVEASHAAEGRQVRYREFSPGDERRGLHRQGANPNEVDCFQGRPVEGGTIDRRVPELSSSRFSLERSQKEGQVDPREQGPLAYRSFLEKVDNRNSDSSLNYEKTGDNSKPVYSKQMPSDSFKVKDEPAKDHSTQFQDHWIKEELEEENNEGGPSSSLSKLQSMFDKKEGRPSLYPGEADLEDDELVYNDDVEEGNKTFHCHVCPFVCSSAAAFKSHLNGHYVLKCPNCEFSTTNDKHYGDHLKSEHGMAPEEIELERDLRTPKINSQGKVKSFKCKQCDVVSVTREEFWVHTKSHIKPEKLLTCPKCPFVTEYKHHLEYHLRNHFGSKPFKCSQCNYSCVNKSMLNSHMKSHTAIYQYRCMDCTYATKYCHSLKLHLRKYDHKPSMVLNPDGTPNPLPIIDVYGTRRGPKVKKDEGGMPTNVSQKLLPPMQHANQLQISKKDPHLGQAIGPKSPMLNSLVSSLSGMQGLLPSHALPASSHHSPEFRSSSKRKYEENGNNGLQRQKYEQNVHGSSKEFQEENKRKMCKVCPEGELDAKSKREHLSKADNNGDINTNVKSLERSSHHSKEAARNISADADLHAEQSQHALSSVLSSIYLQRMRSINPFLSKALAAQREQQSQTDNQSGALDLSKDIVSSKEFPQFASRQIMSNEAFGRGIRSLPYLQTGSVIDYDRNLRAMPHSLPYSYLTSLSQDSKKPALSPNVSSLTQSLNSLDKNLLNQLPQSTSSPKSGRETYSSDGYDRPHNLYNFDASPRAQNPQAHSFASSSVKSDPSHQYQSQRSPSDVTSQSLESIPKELHGETSSTSTGTPPGSSSTAQVRGVLSSDDSVNTPDSSARHSPASNNSTGNNKSAGENFYQGLEASKERNRRRKGKAFKIEQRRSNGNDAAGEILGSFEHDDVVASSPSDERSDEAQETSGSSCSHCDITFGNSTLHLMHMEYHSPGKPFTCNFCGTESSNAIELFNHIARVAH